MILPGWYRTRPIKESLMPLPTAWDLPAEKVMLNIQRYGNTTAATIPLMLMGMGKAIKKRR